VVEAARDAEAAGLGAPVVLLSPSCASYDQHPIFKVRGDALRSLVRKLPGVVVPRGPEPSQQF
jgi:UDP-N-acetylmuramoylalanine--D-glutamate ligase